jgi:hypothetical protein
VFRCGRPRARIADLVRDRDTRDPCKDAASRSAKLIFGGHLYPISHGRVLVPLQRLLLAQRRTCSTARSRNVSRMCLDAREQIPSTNPAGVRKRVRRLVAQGEMQPGWLRRGVTAARRARLSTVNNRIIIGAAATAPESSPDWIGRRRRRCLAGVACAARARDARLNHVYNCSSFVLVGFGHDRADKGPDSLTTGVRDITDTSEFRE